MTGANREGSQNIDLSKVVESPDAPEYRFQAKPKGGLPHTLASFFNLIFNRRPVGFFVGAGEEGRYRVAWGGF